VVEFGMPKSIYETPPSRKEKKVGSRRHPSRPKTADHVDPTTSKRGRPRSARADAAIFRATLELLPEHGLRGLSMEAVAAKAGVGKATLYRRFPSKQELVAATLRTIRSTKPPLDTGSVRGDILALVRREIAAAKRVPHLSRFAPRLLADVADEPEMLAIAQETVVTNDREMLGEIVRRGIMRGELRPDLDVDSAAELLHAPLIYRFLMSGGRLDAFRGSDFMRLIDTFLAGLAP
jgi:AcrR family transcriptional regulator